MHFFESKIFRPIVRVQNPRLGVQFRHRLGMLQKRKFKKIAGPMVLEPGPSYVYVDPRGSRGWDLDLSLDPK